MHPTHKKLYQQRITDQLSALEQDNALGQSSQALVTLDQQSVGRLSRMDALQSQAMAQNHPKPPSCIAEGITVRSATT